MAWGWTGATIGLASVVRKPKSSCSATLAPGGVFAAQMPSTARESSHALMRMVAAEGPWASRLLPVAKTQPVIAEFEDYYAWLRPVASRIDMWMTTYVLMFDGPEEIAEVSLGIVDFLQVRFVGHVLSRLDRRQPLAPGPKRVRKLFPADSECAAWKTRIP